MSDSATMFWITLKRFKAMAKILKTATGLPLTKAQELLARIYGYKDYFEARNRLAGPHSLSDIRGQPSPAVELARMDQAKRLLHEAGISLPAISGQTKPDYLALFAHPGEAKRRLGIASASKDDGQEE